MRKITPRLSMNWSGQAAGHVRVYGDLSDGYGYRQLYRFRLTPDGYTILREIDLGAAIAILCPTNTPNPWASLSVCVAYHFAFQPRPPPHNNIAQSPNLSTGT